MSQVIKVKVRVIAFPNRRFCRRFFKATFQFQFCANKGNHLSVLLNMTDRSMSTSYCLTFLLCIENDFEESKAQIQLQKNYVTMIHHMFFKERLWTDSNPKLCLLLLYLVLFWFTRSFYIFSLILLLHWMQY